LSGIYNFKISEKSDTEQILKKISDFYEIIPEYSEKTTLSFYDTYDWRLYNNNLVLDSDKKVINLRNRDSSRILFTVQMLKFPVLLSDLPDSNLKIYLDNIIQMRALVQKGQIDFETEPYRLLDNNLKTVVRLIIETYANGEKFVKLISLRGFQNHVNKILRITEIKKMQYSAEELFIRAMENSKQIPGDYSSKIKIKLSPEMTAVKAMQEIYKDLFDTMVRNEQGIRDDLDTEFLHDHRVAIRRTRSLLSQIKGVLPINAVQKFLDLFKEFGQATNKLRDIDVYLLSKPEYEKRLPVKMQKGIDLFFEELRKERQQELTNVKRKINSATYKRFKTDWHNFIYSEINETESEQNAQTPVLAIATKYIKKRQIRIVREGSLITELTPDEKLHSLRIQCKKLRYLLEFFASLFPQNLITVLITTLKKLQDNLGIYNDLYVQQQYLKEFVETHSTSTEEVLAIGYLVGKLNEEQLLIRKEFQKMFDHFSSAESQQNFNELITYTGENK